jgi:hypothetical protein
MPTAGPANRMTGPANSNGPPPFRRNPGFTAAQWHAVALHLNIDKAGTVVVMGLWLWMAWANGRGHD